MPEPTTSPYMNSKELYLRLLGHVRPYTRLFAIAILGMVVTAATEPALPALFKPLLDESFVARDAASTRFTVLLLIGVFVIRGVATYTSTVALAWVSNKVVMDLRELMFSRILELPVGYYAENTSGGLVSKLLYNVNQVRTAATTVLVVLVRDSLAVLGLLGWMFYLDWQLSLIFFLAAPVISLVVKLISYRLRRLNRSLQESLGGMTHVLEETINGSKVVKVFRGEEYERSRFFDVINWVRRYEMKITTTAAANVPVVQLITVMALAVIVYISTLKGEMSVGGFVSFFGAMAMLFSPIKRLTSINEHLQRGLAAAESVFQLIDEAPEPATGTRAVGRLEGRIEFEHVGLSYGHRGVEVLRDISLSIAPGETVALVGRSGSGKSSLINLIPRFYLPSRGRVLIDGIDIQDMILTDLRANIALVTQDVVLFNDTVAANIAYGAARQADRARIEEAAGAAHAMEFIRQLPDGLETQVGENGVRLSGGQRQRIAIARALYKDAPILILDEATSALDSQAERHVQSALEELRRGRTTLVIAHRLSTVEQADRIVVLEHGEIVETGTHAELMAAGEVYAGLYRMGFENTAAQPAG